MVLLAGTWPTEVERSPELTGAPGNIQALAVASAWAISSAL
jgi:hypothetical protein